MVAAVLIAAILMIVVPIYATARVKQRLGTTWGAAALGAATFFVSQVFHIPLLVQFNVGSIRPFWLAAVLLGLLAGLCEELTRYALFRATKDLQVRSAITIGLGHGGIESFLLGLLTLIVVFIGVPLAVPPTMAPALAVSPPTLVLQALLPVIERAMTMVMHVAFTLLVQHAVRSGRLRWLAFAVLFHAAVDAGAVWMLVNAGPLAAEGVVAIGMIVAVALIQHFQAFDDQRPQ